MNNINGSPTAPNCLVTPNQLRLLNQRSNFSGTIQLVSHLALITATVAGVRFAQSSPLLLLAMLASGIT